MDKLRMQSVDGVKMNVEKIRELFPSAVTEVIRDGKVEYAVDFDILKQELSSDLVEGGEERYQFTWPDKRKSILLANTPVKATLRPCVEESVDFDTTQNLYIEGDNLDVLKLLQETYLGKIKMIYIDPPYNTGNDFVYNDDFDITAEDYKGISGDYDEQGNRLTQNTTSNGRFHTDWLNMIYPRLKVAKDLLTEDGVIFISIGEQEVDSLRKICDEIFGSSNYITTFIWEKTQHFGRQKLNNYSNADYIVCYAKQIIADKLKELLVESVTTELSDAPLFNASNRENILFFPAGKVKFNMKDGIYRQSTNPDYKLLNEIIVKNGRNTNDFSLSFKSRWSNETCQEEIKKGTTFWVKTDGFAIRAIYGGQRHSTVAPRQIIFTNTANPMYTKSRMGGRIDTSENATNEVNDILGGNYFPYPKPVSLIKYLLSMLYDENKSAFEKNFIVLDFFSGSATTAHAVMQLNAEDGGKRKFIMVQLPEPCDEKSEAYKAGYKNICEIGKERIRRAGKRILEDKAGLAMAFKFGKLQNGEAFSHFTTSEESIKMQEEQKKLLDIGFRVLKLDSSNMKEVYYKPADYKQDLLENLESNIKEDRTPLDLLFQVMLELNKPLSAKIEENTIAGKKVFIVDGNDIIACFDDSVTDDVVTAIAKRQPLYAVFRDNSLISDSVAVNFDQIFNTYSPNTKRKVL